MNVSWPVNPWFGAYVAYFPSKETVPFVGLLTISPVKVSKSRSVPDKNISSVMFLIVEALMFGVEGLNLLTKS